MFSATTRWLCAAVLVINATIAAPTASLASGTIVGTTTVLPSATASVNQFLGVPFAKSPPGRFEPPEAVEPWSAPKYTTQRSDACFQQFNYPEAARNLSMTVFNNPGGPPPTESEDCLYLNVYVPSTPAPDSGREVMFWIYGGSYKSGTANFDLYDGSFFAAYQDVIVVAANYRTNAFGFPGAPQLDEGKNNLGLLDQRKAMAWVQSNIDKFGGDPKKVTLFGESAGANSVDTHILAYSDETAPFRAAIMESGQATFGPLRANKGNQSSWNALVEALDCGQDPGSMAAFSCVKDAPANEIKNISEHQMLAFLPIADDITLPKRPDQRRLDDRFVHVPVLFGTNAQEARVFQVGQDNITEFVQTNFAAFPDAQAKILGAYPVTPPETDYDAISEIWTDYLFTCPAQAYQNASIAQGIPSWRYYYNASFPNTNPVPSIPLGVFHSSEIGLVFGSYERQGATDQEVKLSSFMQKAWADFAKDPAGNGPGWTQVGHPSFSVAALGSEGSDGIAKIFDPLGNVDVRCAAFNIPYNVENSS